MKILECIDSLDPALGGTVESTRQRCLGVRALGHIVEVVTLDPPAAAWIGDWPTPVHCVGPHYRGYAPGLVPWLRSHHCRFDIVVVNGIWGFHSVGVWYVLRKTETPYVIIPHGMLNPWFRQPYSWKHTKKTLVWKTVQWRVLREARAVFYTCEMERALGRTLYTPYRCADAVVGLVGTDLSLPDRAAARQAVLETLPEVGSRAVILYLSRLHPMKGCDLLIRAFQSVLAAHPNLHLVIAGPGDGPFPEELRALSAQLDVGANVSFAGQVSRPLKNALFGCAELFALPSHCEAFPLAVVEALGNGVPVLITDKVNIWREISEDAAGLIDTDDLKGTTASLTRWAQRTAAGRQEMATAARRCFEKRYAIDSVAAQFTAALAGHGLHDHAVGTTN